MLLETLDACHRFTTKLIGTKGIARATVILFLALITFNGIGSDLFVPIETNMEGGTLDYARKLADPFADLAKSSDDVSHGSKLNYRIAVPLLCKPFGINLTDLRWLGFAMAIGSIALLLRWFERLTNDRLAAFWWTLFFCSIPVSARILLDTHPFDRAVLFFGVVAFCCRSPWLVGMAVFAGLWADERMVVASFWIFVGHLAFWLRERVVNRQHLWSAMIVVVGLLLFAATRYWVWKATGLTFSTGDVMIHRLISHINDFPIAVFMALESGWFVLALLLALLFINKGSRLIACVLLFFVGLSAIGSILVIDVTRTVNMYWMLLPAVLATSAWQLSGYFTVPRYRALGMALAFSALLLPSAECFLVTNESLGETRDRFVHISMCKPWPVRLLAHLAGAK